MEIHLRFRIFSLLLFLFSLFAGSARSQATDCTGYYDFIRIGNQAPYVKVMIGNTEGLFLVDFATDTTVVDTAGMLRGIPMPATGNKNSYDILFMNNHIVPPFVSRQDLQYMWAGGIREAGLIGTDILSQKIYMIDFTNTKLIVYNHPERFCPDQELTARGFVAASTAKYYANDRATLTNAKENIPTVPVLLNGVKAFTQLDPGFSDGQNAYAVNINKAYFDLLRKNGVDIRTIESTRNTGLTTCKPKVNDTLVQCKVTGRFLLVIPGINGGLALAKSDVKVYLKTTATAAKSCGGISTKDWPAAQIGLSLLSECQQVIFDPFTSRVWFNAP